MEPQGIREGHLASQPFHPGNSRSVRSSDYETESLGLSAGIGSREVFCPKIEALWEK